MRTDYESNSFFHFFFKSRELWNVPRVVNRYQITESGCGNNNSTVGLLTTSGEKYLAGSVLTFIWFVVVIVQKYYEAKYRMGAGYKINQCLTCYSLASPVYIHATFGKIVRGFCFST